MKNKAYPCKPQFYYIKGVCLEGASGAGVKII